MNALQSQPSIDATRAPHAPDAAIRPSPLAIDGLFWRRVAQLLASHSPSWFVRWAPPVIGAVIALLMPAARRRTSRQLARARGPAGFFGDLRDVVATFANFASCITEVLASGSKNGAPPDAIVHGRPRVDALLASPRGVIFATAHTAGWESLGALLAEQHRKRVMIVMQPERHTGARKLHDAARAAHEGVQIAHVGGDPLASLPVLRHLRDGGVVALQIDRVPPGMLARVVRLFGAAGAIPEGPLRLAQLTGAPIVAVYSARTGHRRYEVFLHDPVVVPRRASAGVVDAAAQRLADSLGDFVSARPTQWFAFRE